jgi:hypothetical protein
MTILIISVIIYFIGMFFVWRYCNYLAKIRIKEDLSKWYDTGMMDYSHVEKEHIEEHIKNMYYVKYCGLEKYSPFVMDIILWPIMVSAHLIEYILRPIDSFIKNKLMVPDLSEIKKDIDNHTDIKDIIE